MPLAIPILASPFRMCRCTISSKSRFLTPLLSAHTRHPVGRARICTFHSYLNFNPFNTYAPAPHISFSFCRYEKRGEGRYPCSKANVRHFPFSALNSRLASVPCRSTITDHRPRIRASAFSITYTLSFLQLPCSHAFAHSRGRGYSQFLTCFLSAVCASPLPTTLPFSVVCATLTGRGYPSVVNPSCPEPQNPCAMIRNGMRNTPHEDCS